MASATLSGWPSVTDSDEKYQREDMRASRLSPEATGDDVQEARGDLRLRELRPSVDRAVGFDQRDLVGVGPEAGARGGDIVVDHQVDSLAFRSEEHTSELQSRPHLVCRLLLEKKK